MRSTLAVLTAALASACANPCDRMCASVADMYERCFPVWETSWVDESYADRADFLDRCTVVWGDGLTELPRGSDERADLAGECASRMRAAEADVDCETLLD